VGFLQATTIVVRPRSVQTGERLGQRVLPSCFLCVANAALFPRDAPPPSLQSSSLTTSSSVTAAASTTTGVGASPSASAFEARAAPARERGEVRLILEAARADTKGTPSGEPETPVVDSKLTAPGGPRAPTPVSLNEVVSVI
jgi:hypothetical protein